MFYQVGELHSVKMCGRLAEKDAVKENSNDWPANEFFDTHNLIFQKTDETQQNSRPHYIIARQCKKWGMEF